MFSPSITNLKTNYIEFGKAGIQVAKMLDRNIHINSIDVYLKGDIVPGQTTDFLPAVLENEPQNESQTDSKNNFYADKEVDEMIKIEKLLGLCDKTDFELLQLVLAGFTCSEIADKLYMSTNGIKYKLKGMYKLCDVNNKNEFLKLVGKYIQN